LSKEKRKKPELLLPAGSLEVLKTAFDYGADAVYIGGEAFGLRANAKNFSPAEMAEGLRYAHERGKRVFVTANILAHNDDLNEAERYFEELSALRPDAIIVSDPALFMLAKRLCPGIELHVSTQANNTNYGTFLFWRELGASRVVTARELSLAEIREIRERIPAEMEIETFVHGAMCISYSGRCLLSSFMAGRDANHGECTHPCRWQYSVTEEKRPGESMPVFENERGTFLFNSKDLCMIDHIPELMESGVDSFKIEGRMKTALYAAGAGRRRPPRPRPPPPPPQKYAANLESYREEIGKCTYREYTTGFFFGKPNEEAQIYDSNTYVRNYTYLGKVVSVDPEGYAHFEQKNKFSVGDRIERMCFDGSNELLTVLEIRNPEGISVESAPHPKEALAVRFDGSVAAGELLRMETLG